MAEKFNLRRTQDIVCGLFSEQREEPEDAASDDDDSAQRSEDEYKHNSIFLPMAVAVYSDEGEKNDTETEIPPAKKRRCSKTVSPDLPGLKSVKNEPVVSKDEVTSKRSDPPDFPGPLGAARETRTPIGAWSLLFDGDLLDAIVFHTNQEIERLRMSNDATASCSNETTRAEIEALIGLLYFSGLQKNNSGNLEELWSTPFGSSLYRATMPCKRFRSLIANLRFDDRQTRTERRNSDKFAPIRTIWQRFIENCQNYYNPHESCTVNEQLFGFRGACPFRINEAEKLGRSGMKLSTLNDEETFYMINADPFLDKIQSDGTESTSQYRIRNITQPIHATNRTVSCDDGALSIEFIERMKTEYSLNVVGNGKKNVDCFDQLCQEYTTTRKTQRWPMRIFYGMLDQGAINAYILYSCNISNEAINRTSFLKTLIMSLLEPQLRIRVELPQIRRDLRTSIRKILNIEIPLFKPNPLQAKRCYECPRERDRKTRVYCNNCKRPVCDAHRIQLCLDCAAND